MSTTLFVYSTYERARHKFTEFLSLHDPNNILTSVSPSRLLVEMNSKTYEFAWLDGIRDKVAGRMFSVVIVDELVKLTPEQDSLLKSRIWG
jgi:hypothetical protein